MYVKMYLYVFLSLPSLHTRETFQCVLFSFSQQRELGFLSILLYFQFRFSAFNSISVRVSEWKWGKTSEEAEKERTPTPQNVCVGVWV